MPKVYRKMLRKAIGMMAERAPMSEKPLVLMLAAPESGVEVDDELESVVDAESEPESDEPPEPEVGVEDEAPGVVKVATACAVYW